MVDLGYMLDVLHFLPQVDIFNKSAIKDCVPWGVCPCNRSEAALSEQEHQLREREAEQAEALAALEDSRKTLEGAAAFVQVRWHKSTHGAAFQYAGLGTKRQCMNRKFWKQTE